MRFLRCEDIGKPITLPDHAIEFEFDDFVYHVELAMAAGDLRMPVRNPELNRLVIVDGEESYEVCFTDQPMNRAMFAVKDSFKDTRRFSSFLWRFWATMALINDERLRPWCKPLTDGRGAIRVHLAVLDVGRRMRLNRRGAFNVDTFCQLLEQSAIPLDDDASPPAKPE